MLIRMSLIIGAGVIASAVYFIGPRGSDSADLADPETVKLQTLIKSPELSEGLETIAHASRNPASVAPLQSEDVDVEFPTLDVQEDGEDGNNIAESETELMDAHLPQFSSASKLNFEEGGQDQKFADKQKVEVEIHEDSQRIQALKAQGLEEDAAIVLEQLEVKKQRLEELSSQESEL